MKLKILGTKYEIILDAEEKDYPKLKGLSGYTDFSIKKIVIRKNEKDDTSLEDLEYYRQEVIRHEIIHAFFYESGLDGNSDYARNEELIDWIAIQFAKMLEVFIKARAIEMVFPIKERLSNCPINNLVNPPNVKEAKAIINTLPDINKVEIKIPNFIGADYGDGFNKSSMYGGDG